MGLLSSVFKNEKPSDPLLDSLIRKVDESESISVETKIVLEPEEPKAEVDLSILYRVGAYLDISGYLDCNFDVFMSVVPNQDSCSVIVTFNESENEVSMKEIYRVNCVSAKSLQDAIVIALNKTITFVNEKHEAKNELETFLNDIELDDD